MKQNISDFEIMAPVGSRDSLAAAIQAGAGSVYFGIGQLNMRSHSANHFTIDDLKDIALTCKEHGIKSYLTVNTIIYGEDLAAMREICDAAKEADISAVIACDVAVMTYCNRIGLEVHLSTQLNISNIEALKFYAQFADVVVLARELRLEQVAEIYRQINEQDIRGPRGERIRIEMFCHGALCMAVSGKCYMSLHDANRSANRGESDPSMSIPWSTATRRPCRACSTAPSPTRGKTSGTSGSPLSSTVVFGMATIWDNGWASGTRTTVRTLPRRNSWWARSSSISRGWAWPRWLSRPASSAWATRCSSRVPPRVPCG